MFNRKVYVKDYYENNKDKLRDYAKEHYQKSKEARKQQRDNRSEEQKANDKNYGIQYYKLNKDKYKAYRQQDHIKEKQREFEKVYKQDRTNYLKIRLQNIKTRAKKKGFEFNITLDDIIAPDKCPILNIPIFIKEIATNITGASPNAPSVDRIDNTKGYIKGNVQVISFKANSMKNNATPEELLQFAFWVILTYGHLINKESS